MIMIVLAAMTAMFILMNITNGIGELENFATSGDPEAQFELGRRYQRGTDDIVDQGLAVQWFSKAAAQGHNNAVFELGECYWFGDGIEIDEKKALEYYQQAWVNGHPKAAALLKVLKSPSMKNNHESADLYGPNSTVFLAAVYNRQYEALKMLCETLPLTALAKSRQASPWLRRAFNSYQSKVKDGACKRYPKFHRPSMSDLEAFRKLVIREVLSKLLATGSNCPYLQYGLCRLYGWKTRPFSNIAVNWLQDSLDPEAKAELGHLYMMGLGVKRNLDKARDLWEQASASGSLHGKLALHSYKVYLDTQKTNSIITTSKNRKLENSKALAELEVDLTGGVGCLRDLFPQTKKEAESNNAIAQLKLGALYAYAVYGPKLNRWTGFALISGDQEEIRRFLLAETGIPKSKGASMPREAKMRLFLMAVKFLRLSAYQRNTHARLVLSALFSFAEVVPADETIAKRWFNLYSLARDTKEYTLIGDFLSAHNACSNPLKAVALYRRAAKAGDPQGMFSLARCYISGHSIKANISMAVYWYKRAAKLSHLGAVNALNSNELLDATSWYNEGRNFQTGTACLADDSICAYRLRSSHNSKDLFTIPEIIPYEEINQKHVYECYLRAAESGHSGAQYELGECLWFGEGCDRDQASALAWFRKAAGKGNVDAQIAVELIQSDRVQNAMLFDDDGYQYARDTLDRIELRRWVLAIAYAHPEHRLISRCVFEYFSEESGDEIQHLKWMRRYTDSNPDPTETSVWERIMDHIHKIGSKKLHKLAQEGDIAAQLQLGLFYEYGWGTVAEDYKISYKWLKQAALNGEPNAQAELGHRLLLGIGMEPDPALAVAWWKESARRGCKAGILALKAYCSYRKRMSLSQAQLDDLPLAQPMNSFEIGQLMCKDDKARIDTFDARTQYYLAKIDYDGMMSEDYLADNISLTMAGWYSVISWLRLSAYQGFTNARLLFAGICSILLSSSEEKKEHLSAMAEKILTLFYEHETAIDYAIIGDALTRNYWPRWKTRTRDDDYATWIKYKREAYIKDSFNIGVYRNLDLAEKYLLKAAGSGFSASMYQLGRCYLDLETRYDWEVAWNGINPGLGIKWLEKAGELGHAGAAYNLGAVYYQGLGVEIDKTKSFKRYLKAAEMGDEDAMYRVGMMYLEGDGIKRNLAEALRWVQSLTDDRAYRLLGSFYFYGWGVQRDRRKALESWRKCCWRTDKIDYSMGMIYLDGIDVEKDTELAIECFMESARKGNAEARHKLEVLGIDPPEDVHYSIKIEPDSDEIIMDEEYPPNVDEDATDKSPTSLNGFDIPF